MRQRIFLLTIILISAIAAKSQNRRFDLHVIGEATIPLFQNDLGLGGFVKGMYGVSENGQLTLTAGLSKFKSKNSIENETTMRLIPFLAGYKHNFHQFFIEPQVGFGELGGNEDIGGDVSRQSVGALFWAMGAGYQVRRFIAGIRFQSVKGIEGKDAGSWHNKTFHYTGVYIGYALFQKK